MSAYWKTLSHSGVNFPEPYQPEGLSIAVRGREVKLSLLAEEDDVPRWDVPAGLERLYGGAIGFDLGADQLELYVFAMTLRQVPHRARQQLHGLAERAHAQLA